MAKAINRKTKYVKLMNDIGWNNNSHWETVSDSERLGKELVAFKDWLRKHLIYIVNREVYESMLDYYFNDVSLTPGGKYQKQVDQGRVAVAAVYCYQKIGTSL